MHINLDRFCATEVNANFVWGSYPGTISSFFSKAMRYKYGSVQSALFLLKLRLLFKGENDNSLAGFGTNVGMQADNANL